MKNPRNKHILVAGVAASLLLLTACSSKEESPAPAESPVVVSNPAGTPTVPNETNNPPQLTFDTKDSSGNGFSIKQTIPDGIDEVKQQMGMQSSNTNADPNVVVIGGDTTATEETEYKPSASSIDPEAIKSASTVDEKLAEILKANGEKDTSLLTTPEDKIIEYAESTYNYKAVSLTQMDKEVKEWHEENKIKAGVYQFEKDSNFYLMITAGSKPHSGFQLNVRGAYDEKDELRILFTLDETKSGTLAIETTPTVVIQMRKPTKKINLYNMSE